MFATMAKRRAKRREPVAIRVLVVLLGAVVLTCVGLVVPPLWTAVVKTWQSGRASADCSAFKDPAARACDQDLSARSPAKGN